VVGLAQGVLIVFDDDDGVAAVAQVAQRREQAVVVARVQADARLVEHVDDAHQAHAELGGEADPLRLAAGERAEFAIERQVAEAGFLEEMEALLDALEHVGGGLRAREFRAEAADKRERGADVALEKPGEPPSGRRLRRRGGGRSLGPDAHGGAAGIEPAALAVRAGAADHVGEQARAETVALGVAVALQQVGDDAGKRRRPRRAHAPELELELALAGAVQDRRARRRRQLLPRPVRVERPLLGQLLQQGVVLDDEIFSADPPGLERAGADALGRVGDEEFVAEGELAPEPAAGGARALAVVRRKMPRRQRLEDVAADGAGEVLAEGQLPPGRVGGRLHEDGGAVLPLAKREFERVGQPAPLRGVEHEPVHHEVHGEFGAAGGHEPRLVEIADHAGEANALEPALPEPGQLVAEDGGLGAQEGGQQHGALARRLAEELRHALIERAARHHAAVLRAMLAAPERPEQPGVVRHLGRGGDGAAGRVAAGSLLDGEHGGQAMDEIHVGPVELIEDLAGLRGEALHVFAVALGIERIEGERGLAGAAGAGEDDQAAAREAHLEIAEIVLPGALDVNVRRRVHAGTVADLRRASKR